MVGYERVGQVGLLWKTASQVAQSTVEPESEWPPSQQHPTTSVEHLLGHLWLQGDVFQNLCFDITKPD